MTRWLLLGWLLLGGLWTPWAYANDVVACDPTHPLVPNAVTRVQYTVDFPPTPGFLVYVAPNNSMTAEQITALNTLKAQMDALKPVPHQYWICADTTPVDGILESVTEMTQAQKDAMDAPEVANSALQASYTTEIDGNDLCTATLAEVDARINATVSTLQTQVGAAANTVAGIKNHLSTQLYPTLGTAFKKLARCIRARAR